MNQVQLPAAAAALVSFLAGLLAGKGVFGLDAATWAAVLGSIGGTGATIWAAIAARKSAIVTTAVESAKNETITKIANLPEVDKVVVDTSSEGQSIAANTPTNVVMNR